MSDLKLKYIPILEGSTNYTAWARTTTTTLQAEDLWTHIEGVESDPLSLWAASHAPEIDAMSNATQRKAHREWWWNDVKARSILERRISPLVLNLLPQDMYTTSRAIWMLLKDYFAKTDVRAQFAL
jgi:hypothetical protein